MPVFRAAMPTSWKKAWSQAASFQSALAKATSLMGGSGFALIRATSPSSKAAQRLSSRAVTRSGSIRGATVGSSSTAMARYLKQSSRRLLMDRAPASSRTFFRSPGSSRYLFSKAAMAPGCRPRP